MSCFQLVEGHSQRENLIRRCVAEQSAIVDNICQERKQNMDNIEVLKKLRKEQTTVSSMQGIFNTDLR